ncbi:2-C-methyl-D-erythritol 4-phosphate cytidylyltransferase [Desulfobotulus sp.]|jgi:2-C-methyl-D-erythritol 4-phosphate cytidylyltransferase|uniref:2-C-methyl-D-erythritol 4-phosphate cytidylyltransferase n=1 Tax=Desulfobotulus sp. TaxID=1940337 RepID=UPI002A361DEE|nr:2-C-methyl-D-erythritol 4-phosphate cytidylyltransferase [Desulfobotulus sp.]MDY0162991.1 2-C-methyl-D-erythritol 4-phosphate cytidylyltransferase [Desulfobotulus sp.]
MVSAVAIVVAGGSGTRMGGDVRKQYLFVGDLPLMGHSLRTLDQSPEVESLVLVLPLEDMDDVRNRILPGLELQKPLTLAPGGPTRQASVASGLAVSDANIPFVLIHDAVRPFVEIWHIREVLAAAAAFGAASLAVDLVDTLRRRLPGGKSEALNREQVMAVQTPQAFCAKLLRQAHAMALANMWEETDDAGLVATMGHAVKYIPGSRINIKLTKPEDRALAEAILTVKKSGARFVEGMF